MIRVGIIGLGTVGLGTYRILMEHRTLITEKTGLDVVVSGVAEIDAGRRDAIGQNGTGLFRTASELIDDPETDIIVELIGGRATHTTSSPPP